MSDLVFEEVEPMAASLVAALSEAAGEPWGVGTLTGLLAAPGNYCLVARSGDVPVGYLLARAVAGESEILAFAVLPAHRRGGIGRRLLRRAVQGAQERGAREIFLEVAEDNVAARQLYGSEGFVQVGIRTNYYRRGEVNYTDALILRRGLVTDSGISH